MFGSNSIVMNPGKGTGLGNRIAIVSSNAWSITNFRAGVIRGLLREGYEVTAIAVPDAHVAEFREIGCSYVPLAMENTGTNPLKDLWLFLSYRRLFRQIRPDYVLAYTVKPNIYGSLAAHSLGIPVINNIGGLGYAFVQGGWLMRLVMRLYQWAFRRSRMVFFQNADDREFFLKSRLVGESQAGLLPGSGVDTRHFFPVERRDEHDRRGVRFLLIARLLWDKGIGEYVEAARILKVRYPDCEFALLGFLGVPNAMSVSSEQMKQWVAAGWVLYLGHSSDVRPFIADADCVVLPSYREGTPRTLLEAASMGKPIITTDTVGCRDVVRNGENGFLVKVRNAEDLSEKMEKMLLMHRDERDAMGLRGRELVTSKFDEKIVVQRYLAEIEKLRR